VPVELDDAVALADFGGQVVGLGGSPAKQEDGRFG
jgi:hypothetical protein